MKHFLSHVHFVVNIPYDNEVSDRTYQISVLTADMGLPETNIINRFQLYVKCVTIRDNIIKIEMLFNKEFTKLQLLMFI